MPDGETLCFAQGDRLGEAAVPVPKIVWPQQPHRIRQAWLEHHDALPAELECLLSLGSPPPMTPEVAKAFLRCFYAARDLARAERDLATGGAQTEAFAARAVAARVAALEKRIVALAAALAT